MPNALTITDVTLTYPDGVDRLTALNRVNLHVPGGAVAAITGPSGSGKSSLLAVAATLIRPDSGSIILETDCGPINLAQLNRRAAAQVRRTSMGIVFQQPNLIPALTAVEQLTVTDHLEIRKRRSRKDTHARALELLDTVGLAAHSDKRPAQLSGGQRQRVNIARALMNEPALMVIDEPTSALDSERGAAILDLITTVARQHHTATLLVTHDTTHLDRMDSVYRMVDGHLSQVHPVPLTA
ncbi:ABC transporter ATP-binding protein [Nocardia camponoti]|uniref:ABC transporter ATP-binding protein n=1 Tax=Nocardia camponoti TaxID=1616106 RepID=A0A917V7V8_9NOCA|nr:ABC transporter ATP-binding protein [Nocardia camponoti]GGK49759.1 ABC transporter ATP-binding protein [Nocardia camponoti]